MMFIQDGDFLFNLVAGWQASCCRFWTQAGLELFNAATSHLHKIQGNGMKWNIRDPPGNILRSRKKVKISNQVPKSMSKAYFWSQREPFLSKWGHSYVHLLVASLLSKYLPYKSLIFNVCTAETAFNLLFIECRPPEKKAIASRTKPLSFGTDSVNRPFKSK